MRTTQECLGEELSRQRPGRKNLEGRHAWLVKEEMAALDEAGLVGRGEGSTRVEIRAIKGGRGLITRGLLGGSMDFVRLHPFLKEMRAHWRALPPPTPTTSFFCFVLFLALLTLHSTVISIKINIIPLLNPPVHIQIS